MERSRTVRAGNVERSKTVKGGNAALGVPSHGTPAISTAGSVKGAGGDKKKSRGNQGDLIEGLNVVFDGPEKAKKEGKTAPKGQAPIDIVCVPGLGADPVKTWIQRRQVASRDPTKTSVEAKYKDGPSMVTDENMLPKELPYGRIMVFQYASQWFGEGAVSQPVEAVAKKLIEELKDRRKEADCENRPIIFIGHSLGGIVIEKAVSKAKVDAGMLKVFNSIAGCVFLGCPFTGSPSQVKAALASNILSLVNMGEYTPFLKLLEDGNQQLLEMRDEFLQIVDQTRMLTCNFYETQQTNMNKFSTTSSWLKWSEVNQLIAPMATAVFPGKKAFALNVDHSGLNKFDSPNNGHWITVKNQIKEMAIEAQKAVKQRQNALSSKVDDATYDKMLVALGVNMEDPQYDLERINDTRADSLEATTKMTLGVPEIMAFLEDPNPGALMLTLHPGMGKGMRAVAIHRKISEMIKDPGDRAPPKLCYFFADSTAKKNQSLSMVKAFCTQMIKSTKRLAEHLPGAQKSNDKRLAYDSLSTLADPFIAMTRDSTIGTVYVIIDAIDLLEDTSRQEFFDTVMKETLFASPEDPPKWTVKVKYIFVGLARDDVTQAIKRIPAPFSGIILSPEQLGTEAQLLDSMKNVVRHKVTELAKRMKYRKALLFSLRTEILQRSEGLATWLELAIGEIESVRPEPVNVRSFVEGLKQGLTQLYNQIQKRVLKSNGKNVEYTKEILRTMMLVEQHPTLQELAILADLPEEIWHDDDKIKEYVNECGSFLRVIESTEYDDDWNEKEVKRVQFIDPSAKAHLEEFAKDELGLTTKEHVQHGIIALRCLCYLQGEDAPDMDIEDAPDPEADPEAEALEKMAEYDGTGGTAKLDDEGYIEVDYTQDPEVVHLVLKHNDELRKKRESASEEQTPEDEEAVEAKPEDETVDTAPEGGDETTPEEEVEAPVLEDVEYPSMFWLHHAKLATMDVVEDFDLDDRPDFWAQDTTAAAKTWWPRIKQLEQEHATLHHLTPVHLAAFFNFVPLLDELLKDEEKREERLQKMDSFGRQPLYWAAYQGNLDAVKLMLERGADPNARSHNSPTGVTALHGAAYHGDVKVASCLVEALEKLALPVCPLDVMNDLLGTPLCCAAYNINADIVKLLLSKGASLEAPKNYSMANAVGAAVWIANDMDVIKPLLDAGCNINIPYCDGEWPLLAPVVNNNLEVMEMMLEERHHVNKESRQMALERTCAAGCTAVFEKLRGHFADLEHQTGLVAAAQQGQAEIFEIYPKEYFTQEILDECLYMAADMESEDTVKVLLKLGASANAEGEEFGCALQASAFDATPEITRILIAAGADVNKQGGTYAYALQAAAVSGSVPIMEQLITAGANVNAGPDGFYGNALYAASITNDYNAAEYLVEHGANVNAKCGNYTTALLASVQSGNTQIMTYLLEKGADVNAICTGEEHAMGGTPLILSTFTMTADSAKILLDKGADVTITDNDGMTALICAAFCPDDAMVKLLLEHGGSDVNHHSWKKGTALQAAAEKGSEDCCELLLKAGANVNGPLDSTVEPPIFLAAKGADLETFQLLLEHKADIHFRENQKEVGHILSAAIIGGDKDIVDTLLNDHHLPIDTPLGEDGTAVMLAILHASWDEDDDQTILLRSFFEREPKPDINQVGGKYHTALQVACYRGNPNIVDFVLEHNPDISIQGGFYGNALSAAAAENDVSTIDKLEEHYGDRITDRMKNDALHHAIHFENQIAMEKLLAMGADVLSVGKWGTVLENNEKGLPDEDKNSDDFTVEEAAEEEAEVEEADPAAYWNEEPGKILLVEGWVEKEEEKPEEPTKPDREVWTADRRAILEAAVKKVKAERGIVDAPPLPPLPKNFKQSMGVIHEMEGSPIERSLNNTPSQQPGSPAGSVRSNRLSMNRKPLSPATSFHNPTVPQAHYPSTIVPQPLFSRGGPPGEGESFSIPQHGGPPPPQQYGSPPPQYGAPPQQYGAPPQPSFSGHDAARSSSGASGTPRPPYTPQNSNYAQPPTSPPPPAALVPGSGIQRIARRPVGAGNRTSSGASLASVYSPPAAPVYSPPATSYTPPAAPYSPPVDSHTQFPGYFQPQPQQHAPQQHGAPAGYGAYNRASFDSNAYVDYASSAPRHSPAPQPQAQYGAAPAYGAPPVPAAHAKVGEYQTPSPPVQQIQQGQYGGYGDRRQSQYGAPPQQIQPDVYQDRRQSQYGTPPPPAQTQQDVYQDRRQSQYGAPPPAAVQQDVYGDRRQSQYGTPPPQQSAYAAPPPPMAQQDAYQDRRQSQYGTPPPAQQSAYAPPAQQSAYAPPPQNGYGQPQTQSQAQVYPEQNTYATTRDREQPTTTSSGSGYGGVAAAVGVGAVGGAAVGSGAANMMDDDEQEVYTPAPATQNYNDAMREATPEPEGNMARRYSWEGDENINGSGGEEAGGGGEDTPQDDEEVSPVDGGEGEEGGGEEEGEENYADGSGGGPDYGGNDYGGDDYY